MQISEQRQYSSIFNNRVATCCHLSKNIGAVNEPYIFEEHSRLYYQMHLLESLLCGPVLLPACPPLPHVTILSTSSSSMACIIRHRRRRGAPQKEAGAHTKTFAFLHLIRVVIARQRKRPAPRYLASFYRWRLKRASKCQLLTAEKRSWPSRSHLSLLPSAHLQLTLPPIHPLLRACLTGAL